jgi:hypothetical protein
LAAAPLHPWLQPYAPQGRSKRPTCTAIFPIKNASALDG